MQYDLQKLIIMLSRQAIYAFIFLVVGRPMLFADNTYSQSIHDVVISIRFEHATIEEALRQIEQLTVFKFAYGKDLKQLDRRINESFTSKTVAEVLQSISTQARINFRQVDKIISAKHVPKKTISSINGLPDATGRLANRTITGKVTDENGNPLAGATVLLKGTDIGGITDVDGNYRFNIPSNIIENAEANGEELVLRISFVGYAVEEVTIGNRTTIDVAMLPDLESLMEVQVVSTGYYEVQRGQNPGNIAKIDAEIIEKQPVTEVLQALQGQAAGVQIQQTSGIPGSAVNINIRGLNSLNNGQTLAGGLELVNSNRPFYIVDGVPYPAESLNDNRLGLEGGNPLAAIRPSDIESIEILKDADATAIYGSRGANGVIIIKTKRPEAGKAKFNLNYSRGVGTVPNRLDLLNTEQYLQLRREAIQNDGSPLDAADSLELSDVFVYGVNRDNDWQDELFGNTAVRDEVGFSVSGGTDQTQYLFRGNFFRQSNVFKFDDSGIESGSGHFSLNQNSEDMRFQMNLSSTYTFTNNDQNGIGFAGAALMLSPNAPNLLNDDGTINWADNLDNPLAVLEQKYENRSRNLVSNVTLSYEIINGLRVRSNFGYTNLRTNEFSTQPLTSRRPEDRGDNANTTTSDRESETWITEPRIEYSSELGRGTLNVIVGTTFQGSRIEGLSIIGSGNESDIFLQNLGAAPELNILNNLFSEYFYTAFFSRVNFIWDERYILNLTGRRDGSSRFGSDNRFGNFGAAGAAWIFSEESFLKNSSSLSFGKLRASYGITGNDQIGDYGYLETYSISEGLNVYNDQTALVLTRAANPNFSWEENRKLELGLELGFFGNRINLSTSYFINSSDNQLIGRPLSVVTGFTTTQFNLPATVKNRGLEIEFSSVNLRSEDFSWNTSFNFTRYRNELVEFPDIERFSAFDNTYVIGESIFGQKEIQVQGLDPETGEYQFIDFNGDGRIGIEDRQDYVEIRQDFYGGLTNSFRWKSLQLSVFMYFVKQNGVDIRYTTTPGDLGNQHESALDRWQSPGDVGDIRRASRDNLQGIQQTNAALTDASFLRLQNISISCHMPSSLLSDIFIERANVFVNAQNVATITNFEGFDPETGNTNLPPLRIITAGFNLTF